jgi:hypothetical protein
MAASSMRRFALTEIRVRLRLRIRWGGDMADENKPRREDRVALRADIDFRRAGDHRYRVNILDFSPKGCRIESPVAVSVGDTIYISLPGLESLPAKVCWVKEWVAGVEFVRPLYPSVFEMMRDRMSKAT